MEAEQNSIFHHHSETNDLPLLLIQRLPSVDLPSLTDLLRPHFRLLDPHNQPTSPPLPLQAFLSLHASTARAVAPTGLTSPPVAVTNAGGAFTEDVADYAVALLIDILGRVSAGDRYVRSGLWPVRGEYQLGSELGGKRVGMVGLGKIGSAVAKRLTAFGCRMPTTLGRRSKLCHSHSLQMSGISPLKATHISINVGRGAQVGEQKLVRFLTRVDEKLVVPDVFENEPEVPRELFDSDNVVLSPHNAVITPESMESLNQIVLANLKAFFSDKPLLSPIHAVLVFVSFINLSSFMLAVYSFLCRGSVPMIVLTLGIAARRKATNSDILIARCALTKETHHIINNDVLKALGKCGELVNVGRGALVDEEELVKLLVQGELRGAGLGGAGLDVFENEPDVPKELFELDNVVFSPHCAVVLRQSALMHWRS
ncbi:Glyoxylate reductase [Morus notabilis]|uniref:Glyoxylate reductase n=1 Tax=Morus notabilis TaxID=981085 RepID=W9SMX2_9ROSA|nr:Glyoxylate reductase [Morus notabilis]